MTRRTSRIRRIAQLSHFRALRMVLCLAIAYCGGRSPVTMVSAQQQQDPTTMNGGSILAMAGKECVAVAVDKRFGSGSQMITLAPRQVLTPHSHLLVGFTGLEGDVQTLYQELDLQVQSKLGRSLGFSISNIDAESSSFPKMHKLISPKAMASLTSHILYGRRGAPYYVEPIIVGLMPSKTTAMPVSSSSSTSTSSSTQITSDAKTTMSPFLCGMDLIGAQSYSDAFVVGGTASKSLYGTAEALWEPGLEPEDLARVCGMAFQSALERDCLSGYGTIVYVLTKDRGILQYELANRND